MQSGIRCIQSFGLYVIDSNPVQKGSRIVQQAKPMRSSGYVQPRFEWTPVAKMNAFLGKGGRFEKKAKTDKTINFASRYRAL